MVKKEALSTEEKTELLTFVGECVFENRAFPSMKLGADKITIQELLNVRSDGDLKSLGIAVNQAKAKFDPDFSSSDVYKVGGVDGDKFVKMLKLILKHRESEEYKKELRSMKAKLQTELTTLKTPAERRKEIEDQLLGLEA